MYIEYLVFIKKNIFSWEEIKISCRTQKVSWFPVLLQGRGSGSVAVLAVLVAEPRLAGENEKCGGFRAAIPDM